MRERKRRRGLIVLFSPRVHEEENPREGQNDVADCLAEPIPGEILDSPLEVAPPESHEDMEDRAALGEEALELAISDEGDHEEQEADREEEQAGERVGGPDQELVVRRRAEELLRRLDAVAEGVEIRHVEHHARAARDRDRRVEEADHGERPRRRRRRRR